MTRRIGRTLALFAAPALMLGLPAGPAALADTPASASPASAAAASAAAVTLPFAPPIGKPLVLHTERRKVSVRDGVETPIEESSSDDDLVFTARNAEGYITRMTTTSVKVHTAPDRQALMEKIMATGIGKPTLIQTNPQGAPVALLNAPEIRALMTSALDTMVASVDSQFADKPPAGREAARRAIEGFAQMYRKLSDDQLNDLVLRDGRMLFGFGGGDLVPGRPESFKTTVTIPLTNSDVTAQKTVTLTAAGPKENTLTVTSTPDPDDIRAAIGVFFDKMIAGMDPGKQAAARATYDKLKAFTVSDDLVLTLDATSGLPRRAVHTTRAGLPGQTQVETVTYTLTD